MNKSVRSKFMTKHINAKELEEVAELSQSIKDSLNKIVEDVFLDKVFINEDEELIKYPPQKRVIGFDLDGVIFSIQKAIEVMNKKTNSTMSIETMTEEDFEKIYWGTMNPECQVEIIKKSVPNQKMVTYLREEHLLGSEIVIITARAIQYAGITIETLRKFGIPFDRIHFSENKLPIIKSENLFAFYDDRYDIISKLYNSKLKTKAILVSAPYNRETNGEYDMRFRVGIE